MTRPGHSSGGAGAAQRLVDDRTVADLLLEQARDAPSHVFCVHRGEQLTVGDLDRRVRRMANALFGLGLVPGDRVATVLGNGFDQIDVMLACLSSGLIWVPINHHQRGKSLAHLLANAAPAVAIVDPTLREPAAQAAEFPTDVRFVPVDESHPGPGPSLRDLTATATDDELPRRAAPDDVVCISYTSGTTGRPKGVMLTNRLFRACAAGVQHTTGAAAGDVAYVWEPLHHNGGNQMVVLALTGRITLALARSFSASRFWSDVRDVGASHVHYLGGVLQILLKQERTSAERDHPVKVLWGGGCPREVWGAVERRFGLVPREVYGMTETASVTTANLDGPSGSVGRALPYFEVGVMRPSGSRAPVGTKGEIWVREREPGLLTRGYYKDPAATDRLLPGGPWLRTGDCGSLDADGNLFFYGRLNDSVRHRGENVSAWEVESVLSEHPLVAECAMVGVPADIGEQDIKVFVRPVADATMDPASLVEWCSQRMARYQVPRYVAFVESFEKTPTQRIKKELLLNSTAVTWDREGAHEIRGAERDGASEHSQAPEAGLRP